MAVDDVLSYDGIEDIANRRTEAVGGQMMRAICYCVGLNDPLILDEPTVAMDNVRSAR